MKLTLLRHGQTEGSLRDLYYGATDLPVLPESLAAWYGVKQLGGMSGDVSGFALTLGELCGLAVLTLVR